MDIGTIGGIVLAIACILGGQALEGGHAGSLVQATAAIIVLGGTIGAVLVSFPMSDVKRGLGLGKLAFGDKKSDIGDIIKQVVELAGIARREGVLALEQRMAEIKDPFLKRSVGFLVDGVDAAVARDALETEINTENEENVAAAKVFEAGGGYSPTVGIIGAVLGLIHVMENLSDPSKLGGGIATAFVATVYGVAVANLIFLPMANKIKRKLHGRERAQDADRRGRAVDPGRPQPARPRGEAGGLRRPPRAAEERGRGRGSGEVEQQHVAKKQKHEEHENHERWLVSYADFITLLFAFFVVLYSISRVDNKRMAQVQQSIKFALHFKGTGGIDQLPLFEGPPVDGGKCRRERGFDEHPKTKQREQAEKARKRMEKKLKTFLQLRPQPQVVQIETERDRITVRLSAAHFFDPSQAAIRPEMIPILDLIADELVTLDMPLRIEGHTDESRLGHGPLPRQLGAVVVARRRGRELHRARPPHERQAAVGGGLRLDAPAGRGQHRRRARGQPPRRDGRAVRAGRRVARAPPLGPAAGRLAAASGPLPRPRGEG